MKNPPDMKDFDSKVPKNSKTSHNKQQRPGQIIFTKADMRKMQFWLDTEQYQKNGRYKKKSHFTPSALTFKEL